MKENPSSRKSLAFLLPAHNEAKILASTVKKLLRFPSLRPTDQILIIENGSTDSTREIALRLSKQYPQVRIIVQQEAGYGPALKAGIIRAKEEILLICNADYYDFEFFTKAIHLIHKFDVIAGSKRHPESFDKRSLWRKIITYLFTFLIRILYGYHGSDTHGLKVLRRSAIYPIVNICQGHHWLFDTELMIRSQREGLRILELPVSVVEQRSSVNSLLDRSMRAFKELYSLFISLNKKPLVRP